MDNPIFPIVAASRRTAGTRQVELEVGGTKDRVEIDIPVDHPATNGSRIAFGPKRWRVCLA